MTRTPKQDLLEDLKDPEFAKAYVAERMQTSLAIILHLERLRARLTEQELAEKAGVTKACITKLECGEGNPRISTIGAVLASLGVILRIFPQPLIKKGGDQE